VINGADLVEHNMPGLPLKPTRNAKGIAVPTRRQRGDDECVKVRVQFVGRNHDAGLGLANLTPAGRIQISQKDITSGDAHPYFHRHASSSKRVGVGSTRS